jgi:lipopolysaccharide assembly protein A
MKIVAWAFWLLVFAALLLFAARNTDPVTVRFYLDSAWEGPLILALLAFFAIGVACGVLACMTRLLRQRREIVGLKRELRARSAERVAAPPEAAA